jgi:hypothetical protein
MALNRAAVRSGLFAALPFVAPAAVANAWLAGQDHPNGGLVVLSYLMLLLGFTFGGFAAARLSDEGTPLLHGAAGATAAWAVLQLVGIFIRVSRGDGVRPASIVFTGLLAASAGVVGGILAARAPGRISR